MLRLEVTSRFKKDLKRLHKRKKDLTKLYSIITKLQEQKSLEPSLKDYPLTGNYKGLRELHIEPDWLLIYAIYHDRLVLIVTRTGSPPIYFKNKRGSHRIGFISHSMASSFVFYFVTYCLLLQSSTFVIRFAARPNFCSVNGVE